MDKIHTTKQKGVSLIITFFIMIIVLAVVTSISILLYSGVKVIRNVGNSVVSFYAADSGVEKVLYYDRQVYYGTARRGLCSMETYCSSDGSVNNPGVDHIKYCNLVNATMNSGSDCNPVTCTNCTVTFSTNFSESGNTTTNKKYTISAAVGNVGGTNYSINIKSNGEFGGTGRKIETFSVAP